MRAHLVHAGTHLLRHAPVQGKAALGGILATIASPSFPDDVDRAQIVLKDRLARAKEALLRNTIKAVLKSLIYGGDASIRSTINALVAVGRMHGSLYEHELRRAFTTWEMNDEQLAVALRLAGSDHAVWHMLPEAMRVRPQESVARQTPEFLRRTGIYEALSITELTQHLLTRFTNLSTLEKHNVIAEHPRREFANEAVQLFSNAPNFRSAEALGASIILPMANHFGSNHVAGILEAAAENGQIWYASGMPQILEKLFQRTFPRLPDTARAWGDYIEKMGTRHPAGDNSYKDLRQLLSRHSISFTLKPPAH